jgi:hypothetical protein
MFREFAAAVTPRLGLSGTLNNWAVIVDRLAEPKRKRQRARVI